MDQININDGRLFPTKTSFFIFWSYISLFVSQGLLVTAVQRSQIYAFNAVIVILLTELVKLFICIGVYLFRSQGGGFFALLHDIKAYRKLLLLYLIPAFLYCLYNNLTFINLELFDVSTYYCLMQFRIVLTAIIYQALFRRQLTLIQWTSLLILTTGCLVKEYGQYSMPRDQGNEPITTPTTASGNQSEAFVPGEENFRFQEESHTSPPFKLFWSTGLILVQMFCSCFAGVYNEYLLKDSSTAKGADVILQNMFMYLDSIICNLVVFITSTKSNSAIPRNIGLSTILGNLLTSPLVIILILNNAFSGLIASLFLKSLNSILKTFASALELFAVTFLAWFLFGNQVDFHTIIALNLVSLATIIYSKNPVSVAPPSQTARAENRDGFVLLPMSEE